MADNRRGMLMAAQFKKATQDANEYVKFYINEQNCNEWFILIGNFDGDDHEFVNGEYLLRMEAPPKFPYDPPHFYFYTENGVYGVNEKVCISIGEYHKADYRSALGMSGFANQLWNGMIGWRSLRGGINILNTDVKTKKALAAKSKQTNREKYPELIAKIESCYEAYSAKWDRSKMPLPTQVRLGFISQQEANEIDASRVTEKMENMSLKG